MPVRRKQAPQIVEKVIREWYLFTQHAKVNARLSAYRSADDRIPLEICRLRCQFRVFPESPAGGSSVRFEES